MRGPEGGSANVLVTDGSERAALAVVRSLGRAGHRVGVVSPRRRSLAASSRYVDWEVEAPAPSDDRTGFLDRLVRAISARPVDVVLPVSEASLRAVLSRRDRLGEAVIPFPDATTFDRISDKAEVARAGDALGISVPRHATLRSSEDLERTAAELSFPLVVKPTRSIAEARDSLVPSAGVAYADDLEEVRRVLSNLTEPSWPVLLQERIVGPGSGIFLLRWEDRTVAAFAHRRLREKPPSGGVSVYRESVALDPDLKAKSEALLEHFQWRGVAMVEFKIDRASGTPHLMEVNGRFWGSLQLAVDAGIDFPALLVAAARGKAPGPVTGYQKGVRLRWLWGDVDHLIARMKGAAPGDDEEEEDPGRLQALRDFLKWRPGDRLEVLRPADPLPFFRETANWFRNALEGDSGPR